MFEAAADRNRQDLWDGLEIGTWGAGQRPASSTADSWQKVGGSLYGSATGAPQMRDVDQGDEGDCWIMATLAALAHSSMLGQTSLMDLMSEGPGGTFDVKLYQTALQNGQLTIPGGSTTTSVSSEFPMNDVGEWLGADPNPHDSSVLWPAILEKAMAAQNPQGYDGLYGGDPGVAMAMLTGKMPKVWKDWEQGGLTAEDALEILNDAEVTGSPMVGGTRGVTGQHLAGGLNGQHAYAVLGTEEKDGQTYVQLYNPFGFSDGDDRMPDGGTPRSPLQSIPLSDFLTQFQGLRVGQNANPALEDRRGNA